MEVKGYGNVETSEIIEMLAEMHSVTGANNIDTAIELAYFNDSYYPHRKHILELIRKIYMLYRDGRSEINVVSLYSATCM